MANPPTARQLSYLRSLADRTSQTFTYPHTAAEACVEINRLKRATTTSPTERSVERKAIADQIATGPGDAARVRDDEIAGYGSGATWAQNRDQEPAAIENLPGRRRAPVVGARTELARYRLADGERVVYGQCVDGVVRVTDRPVRGGGRCYLVERGLESSRELSALVSDYVRQAETLGSPPLSVRALGGTLGTVA